MRNTAISELVFHLESELFHLESGFLVFSFTAKCYHKFSSKFCICIDYSSKSTNA